MSKTKTYENYPLWIPALGVLLSILTYILGAYILLGFGIIFSIIYLIYCFGAEINVLYRSCTKCYYYGKVCGIGKGRIAHWFFKKGDPKKFADREIKWHHLIPDFLVAIIPIVGGIILLIQGFTWVLLILLVVLMVLFFGGTASFRGKLACKPCKQRELGCPAADMFKVKEN